MCAGGARGSWPCCPEVAWVSVSGGPVPAWTQALLGSACCYLALGLGLSPAGTQREGTGPGQEPPLTAWDPWFFLWGHNGVPHYPQDSTPPLLPLPLPLAKSGLAGLVPSSALIQPPWGLSPWPSRTGSQEGHSRLGSVPAGGQSESNLSKKAPSRATGCWACVDTTVGEGSRYRSQLSTHTADQLTDLAHVRFQPQAHTTQKWGDSLRVEVGISDSPPLGDKGPDPFL